MRHAPVVKPAHQELLDMNENDFLRCSAGSFNAQSRGHSQGPQLIRQLCYQDDQPLCKGEPRSSVRHGDVRAMRCEACTTKSSSRVRGDEVPSSLLPLLLFVSLSCVTSTRLNNSEAVSGVRTNVPVFVRSSHRDCWCVLFSLRPLQPFSHASPGLPLHWVR